jgi:uncharacterized protein YcaQ
VPHVHALSRQEARRIAVRAQLLCAPRPVDLLETVRQLTLVQADPTNAVTRSAELVMWGRLGSSYHRGDVDDAVRSGRLVELQGRLRPAEDLALFRAEMAAWPGAGELTEWEQAQQEWVLANDGCRRDILEKLYDDGPLPSRELPDTTLVPWESSGWNNDRNVRMLLGLMVRRGEVAAAGRDGRDALWDLAERVYPDVEPVPLTEALRVRRERELRSLGVARARAAKTPEEPDDLGDVGEPARIEGVRGTWRLDPAHCNPLGPDADFQGRTVLLSPLDRLVYDRKRMADLFGFDYQLEMYKPAGRRRWGYWALPVLHGDRLVGKVDATAERDAGVLRLDAVHEDGDWSGRMRAAVDGEIRALAAWLGLELVRS